MQLLAQTCFREFHCSTSLFFSSFFWHLFLFVLNWPLVSLICCGIITTQEKQGPFAAFSSSLLLLTSLLILQVSITPSSVTPLPGYLPTYSLAPHSNAIHKCWIIPFVINLPSSFSSVTIRRPELHTIFKM